MRAPFTLGVSLFEVIELGLCTAFTRSCWSFKMIPSKGAV